MRPLPRYRRSPFYSVLLQYATRYTFIRFPFTDSLSELLVDRSRPTFVQNGAIDQSVKTLRAPSHDSGLILAMCGACGGVIEDFSTELAELNNSDIVSSAGTNTLMEEVQELRAKERSFDATKLRMRNLEEREAAVQRREVCRRSSKTTPVGLNNKPSSTNYNKKPILSSGHRSWSRRKTPAAGPTSKRGCRLSKPHSKTRSEGLQRGRHCSSTE